MRTSVKAFQSPLTEHFELIRKLRRQRKSWQDIAAILHQEYGCPQVSKQGCHQFYKRHVRRSGALGMAELPTKSAPEPAVNPAAIKPIPSPYSPDRPFEMDPSERLTT